MKKATIATVKSFVKKNYGDIYSKSTYDHNDNNGHYDDKKFIHNSYSDNHPEYKIGLSNVWIVSDKNFVQPYDDAEYAGYRVSNCCRTFIVAIKK